MSESILKTGLSRLASILKSKELEVEKILDEEIIHQVKEMVGTPLISEPERTEEIDAKEISAAIAEIMTREEPPAEPKKKIFKHDGRMSWAWEVENSADNDEINYLLANHEQPVELGRYLAENLFKSVARRAAAGEAKDSYIDEEGTNLLLPHVPYSPYTDEGAAFFISLAYSWRGMAEQWNAQEQDRIKAEAAERMEGERKAMEAMLAEQTSKMIEKMVKERDAKMAKGDDIFDSSTYITMKPSVDMRIKRPEDFAAIFGAPITPESETSGISKIAAGISMGQLEKSKF